MLRVADPLFGLLELPAWSVHLAVGPLGNPFLLLLARLFGITRASGSGSAPSRRSLPAW
jgi:hypothetical protein